MPRMENMETKMSTLTFISWLCILFIALALLWWHCIVGGIKYNDILRYKDEKINKLEQEIKLWHNFYNNQKRGG